MIADALAEVLREVPAILNEAGLSEGIKLPDEESIKRAIMPLFWHESFDSREAARRDINIIYGVQSIRHTSHADRRYGKPRVEVSVDAIVLKKAIDDKAVIKAVGDIEKAFHKHGYRFEAEPSISAMLDAERTILPFTATKIL